MLALCFDLLNYVLSRVVQSNVRKGVFHVVCSGRPTSMAPFPSHPLCFQAGNTGQHWATLGSMHQVLRGGRVDDCRRDKAVSLTDNKRVLFYATPRKIKVEGYVPEVGLCFWSEINKKCKSFQKRDKTYKWRGWRE